MAWKVLAILLDALVDGSERVVGTALDFYRRNIVTGCYQLFLNQEIYLHPVLGILLVVIGEEKQLIT